MGGLYDDGRPEPPPWDDAPSAQFHKEITATLNGKHLALEGLDLIRGGVKGDGAPKPLLANVATLLRHEKKFFNLRFDDFSGIPYRGTARLSDDDFLDITNWVQRAGIHADLRAVTQAVTLVAQDDRFHQVRDYLEPLNWDNTARIDKILVDHGGASDTPIVHAMTAKWLIQAVARVYRPGCQADSMLILEGKQGLRKSGLFEALSSPWYISGLSDLTSKDALQELRGVWVIEMAELNNMRRSEANFIKAFLTRKSDHYRESYGRLTSDHPRQCVFGGTINPGADGYLKDETGARRFWPVPIAHEIDLDVIRTNRDQYWAEAVSRFKCGENWYMDTIALHDAATTIQADRYEEDEWFWLVEKYLDESLTGETTTAEVLQNAIGLTNASDWGKPEQMRAAKCISLARWTKERVKKDRRWVKGWVREVGKTSEVEKGGTKNDELF